MRFSAVNTCRAVLLSSAIVCVLAALCFAADHPLKKSFRQWTLEDAVWMLNRSPWAQRETFTDVVGEVGSGVRGEKEILSTYFVRFLSAVPVRQAYLRVKQIQSGYDGMSEDGKRRFDDLTAPGLRMDRGRWIVVAVAFRSNDVDAELSFRQHFQTQTLETLKQTTSLSTARFSELQPIAYFAPEEEAVGARFVFPREVDGVSVVSSEDETVTFELDAPVAADRLRSEFSVPKMMVEGKLLH